MTKKPLRTGPKRIGQKVGPDKGRPPDIRWIQCLLNFDQNRQDARITAPKLEINGTLNEATKEAIKLYQTNVLGNTTPGTIFPGDDTIQSLWRAMPQLPNTAFETPAWLATARSQEGVAEISDGKTGPNYETNNDSILGYLESCTSLANIDYMVTARGEDKKPLLNEKGKTYKVSTGYKMSEVEDTPWCAAFVQWCLIKSIQEKRGRGASAQAWKTYGKEAARNQLGAICLIQREPFGDSGSGWHIGFFVGGKPEEGYVALLGGNQDQKVCRKWFIGIEPKHIWMRWPIGA